MSKIKKIDKASKDPRAQGLAAMVIGAGLFIIFLIFVPIEDILTGGVGIVDDPIFIPVGIGGVALFLWGASRLVGRK